MRVWRLWVEREKVEREDSREDWAARELKRSWETW